MRDMRLVSDELNASSVPMRAKKLRGPTRAARDFIYIQEDAGFRSAKNRVLHALEQTQTTISVTPGSDKIVAISSKGRHAAGECACAQQLLK